MGPSGPSHDSANASTIVLPSPALPPPGHWWWVAWSWHSDRSRLKPKAVALLTPIYYTTIDIIYTHQRSFLHISAAAGLTLLRDHSLWTSLVYHKMDSPRRESEHIRLRASGTGFLWLKAPSGQCADVLGPGEKCDQGSKQCYCMLLLTLYIATCLADWDTLS